MALGSAAFAQVEILRSIFDAQLAGSDLPAQFWRDEYIMNAYIARYPKPYVAIMDGNVMGGGVGISAHGSHRIVNERSRVAMPEVASASPRCWRHLAAGSRAGELGIYAGLTATQMNAAMPLLLELRILMCRHRLFRS